MFASKTFAVFVVLPWMWLLLQVLVLGNFYCIIFMLPYLFLVKNSKKAADPKKTNDINGDIHDFILVTKKDASTSTDGINTTNNKACHENVGPNTTKYQNDISNANPFLKTTGNSVECGDEFNSFKVEARGEMRNAFEPDVAPPNIEEPPVPLVCTNPFLQNCVSSPFVDPSHHSPAVYKDRFSNLPFAPRESDTYCKEWVEQHTKGRIKTLRSFSYH